MGKIYRTFAILSIIAGISVYSQYSNNCLINYCPQYLYPFIPNVFYNALSTLTLPDLGILLRNLMGFTTLPNFLNTIQTQSPALFGALNGINGAYGNSFYPMLTSMAQNPAFQTFAQQVTAGGVQPPLTQPQPQGAIPQQQSQPMPQPPIPNLVQSLPQQPQPVPAPQQPQPALAPQPQQPAPQPAGGGLGNLLQPIIEETEQIIDSTEDVIEETGGMNNGQAPQQGMLQGAPQAPVPPAGK
ncbi:hypothetical protein DdX_00340 [Ditylenchus destructor]|uniref:Uncharacterized protein n=1 Tax=Ditylenchus destructor TaxID=166010 RepID=A0AAD4R763_9BILA|nr:hypothetical protein DdX_00340 [Ditylenchus destructor]